MILYFDSIITDQPLTVKPNWIKKDNIRQTIPAYKMPSKMDISKYSLASYAVYPWSHVLIRYELEKPEYYKEFDEFIYNLFPNAVVMHERSDSQEDYKKSWEILKEWNSNWIFFAPNNDHPLLVGKTEDLLYLDRLVKKAEILEKEHEFVSIAYSHFSEYITLGNKHAANQNTFGRNTSLISKDPESIQLIRHKGDFNSLFVLNKKLFSHFFISTDCGDKKVRRLEDLYGVVDLKYQVVVVPTRPLAAHFDAYEHMLGTTHEIWLDLIPPLFIPKGFFERSIKIAYGYDLYDPEYTNINPSAKKYSFRDSKFGTDLKIPLEEIPLFWKERIIELKVNPNLDKHKIEAAIKHQKEILKNPWAFSSQGYNLPAFRFHIKLFLSKLRPWAEKMRIVKFAEKIAGAIGLKYLPK